TYGNVRYWHKADIKLHLLLEADLLHEVLVVPKQPLMIHRRAFPMTDCTIPMGKAFPLTEVLPALLSPHV
ncbi:MAG: hypothetical protein WBZ25_06835, partial [Pseudolabrys sp.]